MSIALIGNCQVASFKRLTAAALPDADLTVISLERIRREGNLADAADRVASCDVVFTQPVDPRTFGPLGTEELKLRCTPIVYPKVLFRGFHPDCVSIAGKGAHVRSPTGNYHSEILISNFLNGRTVDQALETFSADTYRKLRYFEAFDASKARLEQDFADEGYDASGLVDAWTQSGCFMYSFNHPAVRVMASVFELATRRAGLDVSVAADGIEDVLERASRWPVYPEVARRLGIEDRLVFRSSIKEGGVEMGLEDFARQSYEIYEKTPRELLQGAVSQRAMWVTAEGQG